MSQEQQQKDLKKEELHVYTQQIAGHNPEVGGKGFLHDKNLHILYKPLKTFSIDNPLKSKEKVAFKNNTEIKFYEEYRKLLPNFDRYVPIFLGVKKVIDEDGSSNYIALQDLNSVFRKPCSIDIKLGTQTYEDTASAAKIEYEISKYPQQAILGFRLSGLKVYRPNTNEFIHLDRKWGRSLGPDNVKDGIREFFNAGNNEYRHDIIALVISEFNKLKAIFSQKLPFKMIAASVLIIYEGDVGTVTRDTPKIEETIKQFESQTPTNMQEPKIAEVRMIDFAHVIMHKEPQPDVGIVKGLENLIQYMNEIEQEAKFPDAK